MKKRLTMILAGLFLSLGMAMARTAAAGTAPPHSVILSENHRKNQDMRYGIPLLKGNNGGISVFLIHKMTCVLIEIPYSW